ncbi:MAG TPA: TonB family protein [Candidatus Acidoferrum sp.]|nr:TonB family protein [Candidatus Acidoferrum sp.]
MKGALALAAVMVAMFVALTAIDHFRPRLPQPAATPSTAATTCSAAYQPPRVLYAPTAAYPASADALHLGDRTAYVAVTIDASGRLVRSKILKTSGNAALDVSALDAARASAFAPATLKCAPVTRSAAMRFIFHGLHVPV